MNYEIHDSFAKIKQYWKYERDFITDITAVVKGDHITKRNPTTWRQMFTLMKILREAPRSGEKSIDFEDFLNYLTEKEAINEHKQ